jgi:ADP-heptose:LPS heptosyltransferase
MTKNINTILVLKWGALGDMVICTPALRALREAYPDAHITLLTNPLMEQIVPAGTLVDEIIFYKQEILHSTHWLAGHYRLIRRLRKRKYDLAVNLRWASDRSTLLLFLSGARYRVSSGPERLRLLYNIRVPQPVGRYHEIHRNLDIVKAFGIRVRDEHPYVFRSSDDEQWAENYFNDNGLRRTPIFGIHPGASKPVRAWPHDRYREIARRMIELKGVPVLITWGPGEQKLAREVADSLSPHAIIAPETRTIGRLAAIIHRLDLFLTNCTGPMNVAMATSVPMIALLASTHPLDWGPYFPEHRYIRSSFHREHYSDEDEHQAMKAISVEEVWEAVDRRWKELGYDREGTQKE